MLKVFSSRIVIGIILAIVVMLANYFSPLLWAAFVVLVSFLGFSEFQKLCSYRDISVSRIWTRIALLLFFVAPFLVDNDPSTHSMFVAQAIVTALAFILIITRNLLKEHGSFEDISASMWGVLYLGFLPSFAIWMRGLEMGFEAMTIVLWTVGLNDAVAMLLGRALGRTPLSPEISPRKTVEGSIAGLLTAAISFYLMVQYVGFEFVGFLEPFANMRVAILLFIGLVFGLIAQIGDLLESLFKRGVGVKDSGSLLSSHGGVLDRTDSHFATAWLGYLVFGYLLN